MINLNEHIVTALSQQFGNTFYLLDSQQYQKNYRDLCAAFRSIYPNFNIAYSYKTNYTPKLCKIMNELGGYAEVVSDMEMEIALRVGVPPRRIIWNGPIKNSEKVRQLLVLGGTVNLDSVYELDVLEKIARENPEHTLNVGIRCNFDVGDGVVSRFGFDTDSDEFQKCVDVINKTPNLHLINLQCHFAKRSVEYWPARAKGMVELYKKVASIIGYMPERIDIGGGLYGNMDAALKAQFTAHIPSFAEYAQAVAPIIAEAFPDGTPELLIEPGSAMVGDCMKFVARVESMKDIRGKCFVTAFGSQKNISMEGVNPPMEILKTGEDRMQLNNADIVGYTCIEGDVLYRGYCGDLAVGDFLVFSNCGSYSVVMKPPFIMPNCPILDISGEKVEVLKRQEYFDDLLHTFAF